MTEDAKTLWRWIETELLGAENTATAWNNKLDYGTTVTEDDIDGLVSETFGGYERWIQFRNGETQYKLKALPVQNKHTRTDHAYKTVKGGGENKVNIVAWPAKGGANVFNLHIQVRLYKKTVAVTDDEGWTTKKKAW
ncbi:MAG: hypothetical protein KGN16_07855 [Burkholderiales bacterium]|nr:hypothetical protein [Burkholderiales bacterium]MDE1927366.1 hypothetical protein [Burkholderiales bacterium]MDE2159001.1 hypothetical protein [Burkholderiales bacterium]MDE2368873.1 hypothetical protein [Burkholderiales bacterium]